MIDGWEMTRHAIKRALDMAVDGEAIRTALLNPEGSRPSRNPECPDAELRWGGRLCLVVNPKQKRVITVMWNTGYSMPRTEDDELWWRDP